MRAAQDPEIFESIEKQLRMAGGVCWIFGGLGHVAVVVEEVENA